MLNELNESILLHDGDSIQAIIAAIKVMKEFDEYTDEIEGEQTIEKAREPYIDILHWLFLASKGKIDSILTIACSQKEVRKHFDILQKSVGFECNNKVPASTNSNNILPTSLQKPLEIIAASSSST